MVALGSPRGVSDILVRSRSRVGFCARVKGSRHVSRGTARALMYTLACFSARTASDRAARVNFSNLRYVYKRSYLQIYLGMTNSNELNMWNNESELNFIEIFQTEPVLWEPNHKFHKDRKRLHDAWVRISDQTGFSVDDLKKKKDSLMATYRGHLRKIKNSLQSGAGCEEVHKPIWFAFDLMNSFLGNLYKCKNTINTENQVNIFILYTYTFFIII